MIQTQYLPNTYTASGVSVYPFTFRIIDKADLVVKVNSVVMTLNVDYAIADAYVDNPAGGQIVFGTAPTAGLPIVLSRVTALTQLDQFVEGGPFPAAVVEEALDKLTMIEQEQSYEISLGSGGSSTPGTGLSFTHRQAVAQNDNSAVLTHSLNNANTFLVMAFFNFNSGMPFIIAQDANSITISWVNECPYSTGGSLQWGVL